MIATYKIRVKVTLQPFNAPAVDLTPYVKEIMTNKSLGPPSGNWQVSLLPFTDQNLRSWYYRVSPMDYIEIAFSRDPARFEPKIIMRGFVDRVAVSAQVDAGTGRPYRGYTIAGRDFGKILEIAKIYYLKEIMADIPILLLPGFAKLEEKYGVSISGKPVEIMESLLSLANQQIGLLQVTNPGIPKIKYMGSDSIIGEINQFSLAQEDGSVWDLMAFFDNSPWNELFLADFEAAPYLIFRKTPWKNLSGGFVQENDSTYALTLPETTKLKASDILGYDLSRSDNECRNYFFTAPSQHMFHGETSFKAAVLEMVASEETMKSNPYFIPRDDRDAGINRFGFRRFENNAEFIDKSTDLVMSKVLCTTLNQRLRQAMALNSAFEAGSFQLRGNENLSAGTYLSFRNKSGVVSEYYVMSVAHSLSLVEGGEFFRTSVEVVRGTGYLTTRDNADQDREKLS